MQINIIRQRRKTASIVINDQQEVIVKVPNYMTQKQIETLVATHKEWIDKTVNTKKEHMQLNDWYLTNRQLYLGCYWPVKIKVAYGYKTMIVFSKELGFVLTTDGSESCARAKMEEFYRMQAKEMITPIVEEYSKLIGVNYQKITIRQQATRWGSCSSKGNLSFNMKIIFAPIEMVRYVVLHEVVHLKHFNHSKAFWQEVAYYMPDYKECMNYFKEFGKNFII